MLGDEFDKRSLLVVMGFALIPDLDTFLGIVVDGAHRAMLHNIFVPVIAAVLIYLLRDSVRVRWGGRGVHVAWVGVFSIALAGIAPDMFYNGVNLFYPFMDQFVTFDGQLYYSTDRGLVKTLFETQKVGTTETLHYSTGVDPAPGSDAGVERVFPIVNSGLQFVVSMLGFTVAGTRLWLSSQ